MGSTKYTPGPWTQEGARVLPAESCGEVDCCGIAECFHGSRKDVAEANARLIAAAPDLLEALRVAYSHLDPTALRVSHCKDLALIDAAIAKAVGHD